jgi:hypothetical protein
VSDARGAVYVEFLIAFLPILAFFMALIQLTWVNTANIVVKHAAVIATRAATIVIPDDQNNYDTDPGDASGERMNAIVSAARGPLYALDDAPSPNVSLPLGTHYSAHGMVKVRVDYDFPCRVPIGGPIVCALSKTKRLSGQSAMPLQWANYKYE